MVSEEPLKTLLTPEGVELVKANEMLPSFLRISPVSGATTVPAARRVALVSNSSPFS